MIDAELLHNPRVVAGTLAGFEAFRRFRSAVFDPLQSLLPIAVEVEAVPPAERAGWVDTLRAGGFLVDDHDAERARLTLAGPRERFALLAARRDLAPEGLAALVRAAARAVEKRFADDFVVPLRHGALACGAKPLIMGVLNVTPDSFSDGGRFADRNAAIERAFALEAEGADLLDLGAESTRPGAREVPAEEEWRRLAPLLEVLAPRLRIPISVDTRKAAVAERALAAGAALVNDVSGLDFDPRLAEVVARGGAALVVTHARGTPRTMQQAPRYDDAVAEICRSLRERLERATRAGVPEERSILDPGIGFGKRVEDNLDVLARIAELRSLGRPLLLGCSRKSFLGHLTGRAVDEREAGTAATTALAARHGVKIVRVHDVARTVDVLKVLGAIDDRSRVG